MGYHQDSTGSIIRPVSYLYQPPTMTFPKITWLWLSLLGFFVTLTIFSWLSFGLTAPNLVYSSWPVFWKWQVWMWQTFFNNRIFLTSSFTLIIMLLFIFYYLVIKFLKRTSTMVNRQSWFKIGLSYLLLISPLMLSNNALSYDVFNYIFNAKMVVVYQVN